MKCFGISPATPIGIPGHSPRRPGRRPRTPATVDAPPLVYVNTLMLQDVLAEHNWSDLLTLEDRRGLTPLFWQHVLPYGEVKLDINARLEIGAARAG